MLIKNETRIDFQKVEETFCISLNEVVDDMENVRSMGIGTETEMIDAAEGVDALITKLQRIKIELLSNESSIHGLSGSLVSGIPSRIQSQ
jgi:hypothetical protein